MPGDNQPPVFFVQCNVGQATLLSGTYIDGLAWSVTLRGITTTTYWTTTDPASGIGTGQTSYDGTNVKVGDWVATSASYGKAFQIYSISSQTSSVVSCVLIDVDGFCSTMFGTSSPDSGRAGIFRLNEDGLPALGTGQAGTTTTAIGSSWQTDLISHFAQRNLKTQYVYVNQSAHSFVAGDSIYIDSSGVFYKSQNTSYINQTIGVVTDATAPTSDWFTFRPFGHYFDTTTVPLAFFPTGFNPGDTLYVNTGTGAQYVTSKPGTNAFPVWQMITSTKAIYIGGTNYGGSSSSGTGGTGYTGPTGPTGPPGTGPVSGDWDGGTPFSTYGPIPPVIDAGGVV